MCRIIHYNYTWKLNKIYRADHCFLTHPWNIFLNLMFMFVIYIYSVVHKLPGDMWLCNSLVPGRCGNEFKNIVFKLIMQNRITLALIVKLLSGKCHRFLTNDKLTLVQVMVCCRQTTTNYLCQRWPRPMSPYCVTGARTWSLLCQHMS